MKLRISNRLERAAVAPAVLRGPVGRVRDRIHLPVGVVVAVGPEAAPIPAPGQVERHRASHVVGVLELLEGRVGIRDLGFAIQAVVIGRHSVAIRVGHRPDTVQAVVGKGGDGGVAVERRTRDGGEIPIGDCSAVSEGGGFVSGILSGQHLAKRVVGENGRLAGGVGLGERLVQRIVGERAQEIVIGARGLPDFEQIDIVRVVDRTDDPAQRIGRFRRLADCVVFEL